MIRRRWVREESGERVGTEKGAWSRRERSIGLKADAFQGG